MEKFEKISGIAAPMPLINIDTDMIIPKQFLKTIKRSGLGVSLFDEMRYDDNGDEITTQLSSPESFITSFLSYINQKKATDNLECITDCDLLRISRPKMLELIAASETFKNFSLIIFQEAITTTQSRANDLATLTAEIKYKKLLNEQPQLIQNIPLQYIASYLGIKPQSLSRIRNLLNK